MNRLRWNLLPPIPPGHPIARCGLNKLTAQLLYNRGLTEPSQVQAFITADRSLSFDAALLPDIPQAVARVYRALLSGEKMAAYGDFDADGITGTALLTEGLAALGGNIVPYIPHRLNEGHGLNSETIETLNRDGVSLVITVDCGITGIAQTERANSLGMDVIITDHHTPLDNIPPAVAAIDPKRKDSKYPFRELSGVGTAFKFLQAVYRNLGRENELDRFLDLVALGTVADIMPLLSENRYLVKQGLKLMNEKPRAGIKQMMELAGCSATAITAEDISWILAPRLNTTGRLDHALASYRLMITDSPEEARKIAQELEEKNSERQRMTSSSLIKAKEDILAGEITPLLFSGDESFPPGILGLVAGRLTEEFYRPSVVVNTGDDICTGSCRSIPEFDIVAALARCSGLLTQFGGHPRAAGFTMPRENLPALEEELIRLAAAELAGIDLRPRLDIDAQVTLYEVGGNTYQTISDLAPYGQGNPLPSFISRGVEVCDCQTMGNNGDHLRLKLRQNGVAWDAVAFRLGAHIEDVHPLIDIVYNLKLDRWGGQDRLRLNILDFMPSK